MRDFPITGPRPNNIRRAESLSDGDVDAHVENEIAASYYMGELGISTMPARHLIPINSPWQYARITELYRDPAKAMNAISRQERDAFIIIDGDPLEARPTTPSSGGIFCHHPAAGPVCLLKPAAGQRRVKAESGAVPGS
jgi:hypothetical protein